MPEPETVPNQTTYMQNRELSWLKFNERVLQEANRNEIPLLERLKFVSIFTSNLNEFFMVRVGQLMDSDLVDKGYLDNKTGMTAREQLDEIFSVVASLYVVRAQTFATVLEGLFRNGVQLLRMQDLPPDQLKKLKQYFTRNIQPLLSPQIIDSWNPFPHITNGHLHIAVSLKNRNGLLFGLIAVPLHLDRMIPLEGDGYQFVLLEDLIYHFTDIVFGIYRVVEKNIISVTRNADINTEGYVSDEEIDYRQYMKKLLKKRQRLAPVRLELMYPAHREPLEFFCDKLRLSTSQAFISNAPLDISFCFSLDRMMDKQMAGRLLWPAHKPAETLAAKQKDNILKTAAGRDVLLSYPFESITPCFEMLRQAAEDPSVLSIKITLYRIDIQSKLAEYLARAAENGKEVVVLIELRARFDEDNNIEWSQRLEEAGCRIIYGLLGYKVHSKICLVTRQEFGKIRYTTLVGTGNFNEKTAKQYTDLSLITANQEIGHDAANFFANLLLGNLGGNYRYLWVAPGSLKQNILRCIEQEREKARAGTGGSIVIKCNSLTDKGIIEKLAEASGDGVSVSMIVRGICCLIPQIPGLTQNIRVISIVGRFLEHSRIFSFGSGPARKLYISSADLMTRNTTRRVEVACPILDPILKDRLGRMLEQMLMDNTHAWEMYADGRYVRRRPPGKDLSINSQELFARNAASQALDDRYKREREKGGARTSFLTQIAGWLKRLMRRN